MEYARFIAKLDPGATVPLFYVAAAAASQERRSKQAMAEIHEEDRRVLVEREEPVAEVALASR